MPQIAFYFVLKYFLFYVDTSNFSKYLLYLKKAGLLPNCSLYLFFYTFEDFIKVTFVLSILLLLIIK